MIASGKSSLQKAIMCLENAVDLAKQQKLPFETALALYELAKVKIACGKTKKLIQNIKEASDIFKRINAKTWLQKVQQLKTHSR